MARIQEVFSEEAVDELRKQTGYNPRKRVATAHRLLHACLEAFLFGKTLGFAVIRAFFIKRFGAIQARAFQLRFKSEPAVAFFRAALDRMVKRAMPGIVPEPTRALASFADVVVYDGTCQRAPRRGRRGGLGGCTKETAGSKWVIAYSLRSGMMLDATMGAAKDAEMPMWNRLAVSLAPQVLYLLDLGYFARATFEKVRAAGADLLMRLKADENLRTKLHVRGGIEHGQPWSPRRSTTVSSYLKRAKRRQLQVIDLDVEWGLGGKALPLRVVGTCVGAKWFLYLTTVSRERMDPSTVCSTYRLRWLIEFLFREWKQQADWGRSATADRNALEALTYASMLGHALVRSLRIAAACRERLPLESLRPLACFHAARAHASDLVSALLARSVEAWIAAFEALIPTLLALAHEPRTSPSRPRIACHLGALGG